MDVTILTIKDIKGSTTLVSHKDHIELQHFAFSAYQPMAQNRSNSERAEGRVALQEIQVGKLFDESTAALYNACAEGTDLGQVFIQVGRNNSGVFMPLLICTLENCMIAAISTSAGGGVPSDSVTLSFTKFGFVHSKQGVDANLVGTGTFGWDIVGNVSYVPGAAPAAKKAA